MSPRLFRYLEPAFYAGLLDDPLLWLRVRPLGRSLLFDCGQIAHMAKRAIREIDALFITHCHMDHFMGMDTLVRHVHVAPRTFDVFGPPGIATRLERKLGGYDWNLTEPHWCSLRVHEVDEERSRTFVLPGAEGFASRFLGEEARQDAVLYRNAYMKVEAGTGDHKLPVLFFRASERPAFLIDPDKVSREGLAAGEWLKTLQKRFHRGELEEPIAVLRRSREGVVEGSASNGRVLYEAIRGEEVPASIGYFTDLGWTAQNRAALASLLRGVTLLMGECTFLAADRNRARESWHLCTTDVNALLAQLRPRFFLPMHLSKAYIRDTGRLFEELAPPEGTTVLRHPDHIAPRPYLPEEIPLPTPHGWHKGQS